MQILKGTDLHKSYGTLHVLKGVDLEVDKGEVVSIIGKSGAGKSTLLHIVGTLDTADSGDVEICGQTISSLGAKGISKLRNQEIGFIFQFHHLLSEFTALENVCIPAYINGGGKARAESKGKRLLEYLGLGDRLDHKPGALSGGEQQRVAVARALINDPQIIFADEPTGNLDTDNSAEMHKLFLRLRDDFGQTFVIVTHNNELATMSDRILHMQDGQFVD